METKIIKAVFGAVKSIITQPRYRYDYGQIIEVSGITLPESFEARFSNAPTGTSVRVLGSNQRVAVPDDLMRTGKSVWCYITVHDAVTDGRTMYSIRIPIRDATERTDAEPTPVQQDIISQAIAALNSAVERTAQDVESADASAQSASDSADRAETARDTAGEYANDAESSAASASTSASQASTSATASAQSASQSAQIKTDVQGMVSDAQGYAESASQSASASAQSASDAQGYANSASASAQSASGYASSAQTSAQTASAKAQDASTSAQTASQKATESAQSATNASQSAQTAESAKTASQTAQGLAESARDSAISAKNDAEQAKADAESARDEAQSIVDGISGALDDKADIITDTASGAIASFTDGADNLPLKSLIVDINPIQDLHGYDSPWPAGGGKNIAKFADEILDNDRTQNGITFHALSENQVRISGTATGNAYLVQAQTYEQLVYEKHLYKAGTYTLSSNLPHNTNCYVYMTGFETDGTAVSGNIVVGVYAGRSVSFTRDTDFYANIQISVVSGTDFTTPVDVWVQLETGSTATAYAPYSNICPISGWDSVVVSHSGADTSNPTTKTIPIGQTVYGGTLDVTTGELVVNRVLENKTWGELANATVLGSNERRGFSFSMSPKYVMMDAATDLLCNIIVTYNASFSTDTVHMYVANNNYAWLYLPNDTDLSTVIQLSYTIASPITLTLTPHEIKSLLGDNNLWADTGDSTVTYRADTKLYINRKIAEAVSALS